MPFPSRPCHLSEYSRWRADFGAAFRFGAALIALAILAPQARGDDYFNQALDRIEESLVRPAEDYGFVVTDIFSNHTTPALDALGKLKEKWTLHTSNGRVHYQIERFNPRKLDAAPQFLHVYVAPGGDSEIQSVVQSKSRQTLSRHLKPQNCSIGQIDAYMRYADPERNLERPDKQPYQILANPCFAPLEITPVELRGLPLAVLPDEQGCRVYELAREHEGQLLVYRFHFSPQHGDALACTEFSTKRPDQTGFAHRTVRRVETWQKLPGGQHVPALFTMIGEQNGRTTLVLKRIIDTPVIGDVPEPLFDPAKIAEFQAKFDQIQNPDERLATRDQVKPLQPWMSHRATPQRVWLIVLNVLILAAVAGILWYRRRKALSR